MTSILKVDTIQDQAGNNIINESSDTITIGASGDTVNIVGTLQNNGSALASGITEADQWRLTADLTGTNATISSNLERIDTAGQGTLGTGMTESSGIFTFPSTGIWLVQFDGNAQNDSAADNMTIIIKATINNSSYTGIAQGSTSSGGTAQNQAGTIFAQSLVDVTNTTNVKVLFETSSFAAASYLGGNTTENYTTFTFIRLGDT
jgi:hypothetical protein